MMIKQLPHINACTRVLITTGGRFQGKLSGKKPSHQLAQHIGIWEEVLLSLFLQKEFKKVDPATPPPLPSPFLFHDYAAILFC